MLAVDAAMHMLQGHRSQGLVRSCSQRLTGSKPLTWFASAGLLKQLNFQAMTESSITQSLYSPPQFTSRDWALACTLLREHALASVVSVDGSGRPFISHVPLHTTEVSTANDWRILGHVANANPHCALLHTQPQAVVTVMGPQAYMSPSVYPDKQRVPTLSLIHTSEPTRQAEISYAAFCSKKTKLHNPPLNLYTSTHTTTTPT